MAEASVARWVEALRAQGAVVVTLPGAAGRCRCHNGPHNTDPNKVRRWQGAPSGLTVHCTYGGKKRGMNPGQPAYEYAYGMLSRFGNGQTPGPLCNFAVDMDGVIYITAMGRANHIGEISQSAADAIKASSWSYTSGCHNLRGSGVDGNQMTMGIEVMANGDMNSDQYAAVVKIGVAFCRLYGKPGSTVHGHGEAASSRRCDDPNLDMGKLRRDVRGRLSAASTPTPTTPTQPAPLPQSGATTPAKDELDMDQTSFNKMMNAWATSAEGKRNLALAAVSATYGDIDGDGVADTIGSLSARTAYEMKNLRAEQAGLAEVVKQLAANRGIDPKIITNAVAAAFDGKEARITLGVGQTGEEAQK